MSAHNSVEEIVREIWESVLGVRGLRLSDQFTEIGGDSIAAVQITSRIDRRFGIRLPVDTLFQRPTIQELVDTIEQRLRSE